MSPRSFALRHGNHKFPILNQTVVGRSPACDMRLENDLKVSRLHARFVLKDGRVMLDDLQSANGVFVNGLRIRARTALADGDVIRIGNHQLSLVASDMPDRRAFETCPDLPAEESTILEQPFDEHEAKTQRATVAVEALNWEPLRAAIRSDDLEWAGRLLRESFDVLVEHALTFGHVPQRAQEELCEHATAMASKTRDGFWLNSLFHLYTLIAQPLPHAAAAVMPQLVHCVNGLDVLPLEGYVRVLRLARDGFTPVQRRLCVAVESALVIATSRLR